MATISARPVWEAVATAVPGFDLEPLDATTHADVTVIGGGLSGLWTALWLRRHDPDLRVLVLERTAIGFGASGRNGGWASALLPMSPGALRHRLGASGARRIASALVDNLRHLRADLEHLEPSHRCGGTIELIRSPAQAARARRRLGEMRALGLDDPRWLTAHEAAHYIHAAQVQGALYSPHCIALDPRTLVHNLARYANEQGVVIRRAEVLDWRPGVVTTAVGQVTSTVIVRATEAYSAGFPATHRDIAPIYSMMIATPPLSPSLIAQIGLEQRTTFTDARHLLIYGQRTSDDRIAFGGRGATYRFGSRIEERFDHNPTMCDRLRRALVELFPVLEHTEITHHWGGPLAMPRDLFPTARYDRTSGLATVGGYTGDGVALSYLAGRTLAALIAGAPVDPTLATWFDSSRRRWEPEPLRWFGVNAVRSLAAWADRLERRPALSGFVDRVTRR